MREDEGPVGSGGLPEELRELGRSLRVPDVDGESMAERVLARLLAEHVPVPVAVVEAEAEAEPERVWWAWPPRWWRALLAALSGVLVVAVLTPPVRAAVVEWLGFGGVAVEYAPGAPPVAPAKVPGCPDPVPVAEAARRAGFAPPLPEGVTGAVTSVAGRAPTAVVGVCWRTAEGVVVRLDGFPGALDPGFVKEIRVQPEPVTLPDGTAAYWFAEPHRLTFPLSSVDGRWRQEVRPAGPTLLWVRPSAGLTLRLEGIPDRTEALRVAGSVR
ncbi:hypothetical protein ACFQ8C_15655 [Streptomyces sp. NPDC056503]|uniref:hypothetical protein n=1 Tax=Streptomyces sp. NPDC056503 TaxID=3345842 RepID=UPI0036A3095E